jgi:predicted DNA-binding protein
MVRTQIQLTEEQAERLKAASARRGVSMAELIRQGVECILSRTAERSPEEVYLRAARAAGKLRSGRHDVSVRHDEYLSEGFSR